MKNNSIKQTGKITFLPLILLLLVFEVLLSGYGASSASQPLSNSCFSIYQEYDKQLDELMNYRDVAYRLIESQASGYKSIANELSRLHSDEELLPQSFVDFTSSMKFSSEQSLESFAEEERQTIARRVSYWNAVKDCIAH